MSLCPLKVKSTNTFFFSKNRSNVEQIFSVTLQRWRIKFTLKILSDRCTSYLYNCFSHACSTVHTSLPLRDPHGAHVLTHAFTSSFVWHHRWRSDCLRSSICSTNGRSFQSNEAFGFSGSKWLYPLILYLLMYHIRALNNKHTRNEHMFMYFAK